MAYSAVYPSYQQTQYQQPLAPYGSQYGPPPQACPQYGRLPPPAHHSQMAPPTDYKQRQPSPSVSYHTGRTPSPTSSPSRGQDARAVDDGIPEGSIYAQNKAKYDNPLAHNDLWAPTQEDAQLRQLPKIDFTLRVKARLSRSAGKPFEPEPRSFQRRPRLAPSAGQPFQPMVLQSDGKTGLIGAGFKPNYFGPIMAAHDVSAADYARFLEDIFTAGKVGGAGQIVANVAPISMHMGLTGYFVTKAIVKGMARRNEPLVVETIETWQERFFGPRGLDVYAVLKGERATGQHIGLNPEPLTADVAAMCNASSASSSGKKKHRKRDHKKDKDGKPFLVIAPLARQSHYDAYRQY